MLEHHPAEGEAPPFKGSMMMAVGESEAEIRALLESDIYAREGVWDMENAQIIPVLLSLLPPVLELQRASGTNANGIRV